MTPEQLLQLAKDRVLARLRDAMRCYASLPTPWQDGDNGERYRFVQGASPETVSYEVQPRAHAETIDIEIGFGPKE